MKNSIQKSVPLAAIVAALTISMGLIGCGGGTRADVSAGQENKPATIAKTDEPAKPAATEQKEDAAVKTADKIGVAECDEYIQKYEICIMSKAPEAQRAMLKSTFEQSRQAWKQAAATPQGKAALPGMCRQALETAKQATTAYSCAW